MAIDLSKLSDEDLDALETGDLTRLSDEALDMLESSEQAVPAKKPAPTPKPAAAPQPQPAAVKPRTALPRDPRIPSDVDPARGASVLLGIPGGAVGMARGVTGFVGAEDTSAQLAELERKIKARAPSEGGYEVGKMVSEFFVDNVWTLLNL